MSKKLLDKIVIIDVESTCWENNISKKKLLK